MTTHHVTARLTPGASSIIVDGLDLTRSVSRGGPRMTYAQLITRTPTPPTPCRPPRPRQRVNVAWVPTVANPAAPTMRELDAAIPLGFTSVRAVDDQPSPWEGIPAEAVDLACQMLYRPRRQGETWADYVKAAARETPWSREVFVYAIRAKAHEIRKAMA